MAKAALTLPNGTAVQIEGTVDEVRALLSHYGASGPPTAPASHRKRTDNVDEPRSKSIHKTRQSGGGKSGDAMPDLAEIVNLAKTCDEAEQIEAQILDRTSAIDRTLLPIYLVHKYLDGACALTSGEISKITTDLGVPISQPNASTALSGTASKYVIGDKVRKRGQAVRYKLARRGLKYMEAVIGGKSDENAH